MPPSSDESAASSTSTQTGLDFAVSARNCPETAKRTQAINADRHIEKPSIARANLAVSEQSPQGSVDYSREHKDYTVLQQHVLFFDRSGNGRIAPWDTYAGFRELGFNIPFSLLAMLIINLNFSYPTRLAHSYLPDPLFRVYVGGIHRAKHGSDTGVYDTEGRFVPQKFEDLFAKWDGDGDGALEASEVWSLVRGNRVAVDPFGWGAALFEFGTTWLLLRRNGGLLYKEDLRQLYDGSLFYRIRDRRRQERGWNQGFGVGGDGFFGSKKVW